MIGDRECISVSLRSMEELLDMRGFHQFPDSVAIIDVETTGLSPKKDEILQIAICDGAGNPILNTYVCPERRRRWPNAQKVNGISWQMVKDAPAISEIAGEIMDVLKTRPLVIGYNLRFDFKMLDACGIDTETYGWSWDIMNDCSVLMGSFSEAHGTYTFVRLTTAAKHYGYEYHAHDALEDAKATAYVFSKMITDEEYEKKVLEKEDFLGAHARVPRSMIGKPEADRFIAEGKTELTRHERLIAEIDERLADGERVMAEVDQTLKRLEAEREAQERGGNTTADEYRKYTTFIKVMIIIIVCPMFLAFCTSSCASCSAARYERLERENRAWLEKQWKNDPILNPSYHESLKSK